MTEGERRKAQYREMAKQVAKEMRCNCDLDKWEPERLTGHSFVCRIHKVTMSRMRDKR